MLRSLRNLDRKPRIKYVDFSYDYPRFPSDAPSFLSFMTTIVLSIIGVFGIILTMCAINVEEHRLEISIVAFTFMLLPVFALVRSFLRYCKFTDICSDERMGEFAHMWASLWHTKKLKPDQYAFIVSPPMYRYYGNKNLLKQSFKEVIERLEQYGVRPKMCIISDPENSTRVIFVTAQDASLLLLSMPDFFEPRPMILPSSYLRSPGKATNVVIQDIKKLSKKRA